MCLQQIYDAYNVEPKLRLYYDLGRKSHREIKMVETNFKFTSISKEIIKGFDIFKEHFSLAAMKFPPARNRDSLIVNWLDP